MSSVMIQEREIPAELLGRLLEYSGSLTSTSELQKSFTENGYLLIRAAIDCEKVLAARSEVMSRLHAVGEIQEPAIEGIATGISQRLRPQDDDGEFWTSVNHGPALREVTHGEGTRNIVGHLLGAKARPHDLMFLRPTAPGKTTSLHYDFPFFAGFGANIVTVWIPLGNVSLSDGSLVVIERSFEFDDLLGPVRRADFTADHSNEAVQSAAYEAQNALHPVDLAEQRGVRLLSTEFKAGDLVIFSGFLMHGSVDNNSPVGRVRLSCDVRYQPASERYDDPRYFGEKPTGSKGGGYADMRGAQPIC